MEFLSKVWILVLVWHEGKQKVATFSRHGDLIFSDQDDVDNYVDNYAHTGKTAEEV